MKLLTVISGSIKDTYGGGQIYLENLLEGFSERGFKTTVLSFVQKKGTKQSFEFAGHKIIEIGCLSLNWKETAESIVEEVHPDIIHAHGVKTLSMEIAAKHSIPCVVTVHHGGLICPAGALLNSKDEICTVQVQDGNCLRCVMRGLPCGTFFYFMLNILPLSLRIGLSHFFEKKRHLFLLTPLLTATGIIQNKLKTIALLKNTAAIVSPCERMKESLALNGIIGNVEVIPHGIPYMHSQPLPPLDGKIKLLYVGRINYVKGVHVLLEALSKIEDNRYELHIVGGSANKKEQHYEKYLKDKYASVHIIWHGKVEHSDISAFLCQCHILILPTICLEIYGLTIAEALAVGRPVLATYCGGAEMQIKDGRNGWLVPPNNVSILREAIIRLLDSPDQIQKCANNCHIPNFQEHIVKLLELYKHVVPQAKQ